VFLVLHCRHGDCAHARAGYGARRWARGRLGRAPAGRFAASQRRKGLEGFEWTGDQRNAIEKESAPTRERQGRGERIYCASGEVKSSHVKSCTGTGTG